MGPYLRWAVFLCVLPILSGCGAQKGAKLQQSVIPPDKTLFQNGSELLEKSRYTEARLALQTLIRTYPDSDLQAEAYLKMGDSYYQEGGLENLLLAEDQFKNFIIFFPTNPRTVDAQMKIININMREILAPDRDQHSAIKAEAEINKFLTMFPTSDYVPIVRQWLDIVQENLALQNLDVGDQYLKGKNYWGAESRYQEIADKYPHFSRMDEVDFKLAQSMQKTEKTDLAAEYLGRIVAGYPFSKYSDLAKAELQKMGKPIPAVDTSLAQQNQSLLKAPVPFSPLRPLIDFAQALGFKGPPDRYKQAQEVVAANKAKEAAGSQVGGKPGDVMIDVTLKKGPDGKPIDPNVKPGATDKKDDKKQDDKTTKKK